MDNPSILAILKLILFFNNNKINMTQFNSNSQQSTKNKNIYWLIGGGCLIALCLACIIFLGVAGYFIYLNEESTPTAVSEMEATREQLATRRGEDAVPATPTTAIGRNPDATATPLATAAPPPTPNNTLTLNVPNDIDQQPIPDRAWRDLETLFSSSYPDHDYFETAVRLGKASLGERTVPTKTYQVGDRHTFHNGSAADIEAILMAVSDHAYFWIDETLELDQTAVSNAADRFETEYYPLIVNLFGDIWTPGIDNDPHFAILHIGEGTDDELGRFNSVDEYPATLYSDSNEQELLYMNLDSLSLGSDLYFGTLVHELQHLIQWYVDPGEALWVNEGLSQLAEIYVELETSDTIDYLEHPETRLNSWDSDEEFVYAHYAGSYLFMTYLWEQLGDAAIQEYARHPANGMAGVRAILQGYLPETTLEQFVADWAAATYLDDSAAGFRYHYQALDFKRPSFAESVTTAPFEHIADLEQFGVNYIDLDELRGQTTIRFAGSTLINLIDAAPQNGSQFWFAPAVDELNAQLTASFDLTSLSSATLKYAVWFELEEDYDYAYVSISTDGGATWDLLDPDNANVGEFGFAYNGYSDDNLSARNGWIKESVSLNAYVGQQVLIRFDVLTDSGVIGRGFAIDDISIPELNYSSDVETGADGWQSTGFVQSGWQLPQQWRVQLIQDGPEPTVENLPLDTLNQGEWIGEIGKGGAVLVIVPLTPFTSNPATYWLEIDTLP